MKKNAILVLFTLFMSSYSLAEPEGADADITGTYSSLHSEMTIWENKKSDYRVSINITGGSCSGESILEDASAKLKSRQLIVSQKVHNKHCDLVVDFDKNVATVTDNCLTEEDSHSTCSFYEDEYKKITVIHSN